MKVLVCGSRTFNDYERVRNACSEINITFLIHGAARGSDSLGERYAREQEIPFQSFPADWNKYGKAAGAIRNSQMLKEGRPDLVLVFLHNVAVQDSRGTRNMIEQATKAGVPVKVIEV